MTIRVQSVAQSFFTSPGPAPRDGLAPSPMGFGVVSWAELERIMEGRFAARPAARSHESGEVSFTVTRRPVGALSVDCVETTPVRIERTPHHVRRSPSEDLHVVAAVNGDGVARQSDQGTRFTSGDFFLVDGSSPCALDLTSSASLVVLTVPRRALAPRTPGIRLQTAMVFRGDIGVAAAVSPLLRGLPRAVNVLDAVTGDAFANNLCDLLATAFNDRADQTGAAPTAVAHRRDLRRAQAYLVEHLHDPDLRLTAVSRVLGFSLSYLHRLFREAGTTPHKWTHTQRLERARSLLRLPACPPASEIAARTGFRDPSHFTRAFKARYGTTPGSYRSEQD